jgi:hypothetical protein
MEEFKKYIKSLFALGRTKGNGRNEMRLLVCAAEGGRAAQQRRPTGG